MRRLLLFLHRLPDLPVHDLELPDHTNRNCPAGANVRALHPSPPHWFECRGGDRHVGVHPHRAAGLNSCWRTATRGYWPPLGGVSIAISSGILTLLRTILRTHENRKRPRPRSDALGPVLRDHPMGEGEPGLGCRRARLARGPKKKKRLAAMWHGGDVCPKDDDTQFPDCRSPRRCGQSSPGPYSAPRAAPGPTMPLV